VDINKDAKYVWFKDEDKSRNPYAAFRRNFKIKKVTEIGRSVINIFADTVYILYINGNFIGFGPGRFDPRFPQYDIYDIKEFLQAGDNVIAILVNFHGHKVFKSIPEQAALLAWGEVDCGDSIIDLKTGPGNTDSDNTWKCIEHKGHSRLTTKLSFALNAQIHYDQGHLCENWMMPGYDDSDWKSAICLKNQNAFGPQEPREIPFMELTPINPAAVTILPIHKTEEFHSFSIPLPIGYAIVFSEPETFSRYMCWSTYIYSPKVQHVTAGVLYEQLWLNGESCPGMEDPGKPLRYNMLLKLNEGWNYLFARIDVSQELYEGYIALPAGKGLIISADKNPESGFTFRHMSVQPVQSEDELKKIPLPMSENHDLSKYGGWIYTTESDKASGPCREASWVTFSSPVESVTTNMINGFTAKKDTYPDGFTLTFDMDHMRLLFPILKLCGGLRGATVDFIYSDRFMPDGQHLLARSWIPLGDRAVCTDDKLDWMPIQPRGFRYMSVTIRNTCGDVFIKTAEFLSAHYPVKRIGKFECSDPLLNKIWEVGALTQYINMEDTYTDCVDRERGLYALDLLIQYHVNSVCFGDRVLMKRALELYGQSIHDIGLFRCLYPDTGDYILPDFCLYIIDSFYAYYRQTNDIETVKRYWQEIMTNINIFNRLSDEHADKLMCGDAPAGDWPRKPEDNRTGFLGDGPFMDTTGINCMFSCMYLITLREVYEMALIISPEDAPDLSARIKTLEQSIPETFWNEEKGLFADTDEHKTFSPQASLTAVNAGIVSEQQRMRLRETIPPTLLPFFINGIDNSDGVRFETSRGFNIFLALYDLGLDDVVEKLIKEAWGHFLIKGLKTTPEHFEMLHSLCHAWTAHPTYMLSRYVLGVEYDALSDEAKPNIKPGTVSWANGTVPIPNGSVDIEWHKENDNIIIDRFDIKR